MRADRSIDIECILPFPTELIADDPLRLEREIFLLMCVSVLPDVHVAQQAPTPQPVQRRPMRREMSSYDHPFAVLLGVVKQLAQRVNVAEMRPCLPPQAPAWYLIDIIGLEVIS